MSLKDAAGSPVRSVTGSLQSGDGIPVYSSGLNQDSGSEGGGSSGDVGSVGGDSGSVGGDSGACPVHAEKTNKQQIRTVSGTANRKKAFFLRLPANEDSQTQIYYWSYIIAWSSSLHIYHSTRLTKLVSLINRHPLNNLALCVIPLASRVPPGSLL